MNKFIKIENGLAVFYEGDRLTESEVAEMKAQTDTALEAFRVEKVREQNLVVLYSLLAQLRCGYTKRLDGSFFVETINHPVIFTPNLTGKCLVEHHGKSMKIDLCEPLEVLVEQVKLFIEPERYRYLERNKDTIQEGDEMRCSEDFIPYRPTAFGKTPVLISRRPLLPNSITSKNFTLSAPKHFFGSHYTVLH